MAYWPRISIARSFTGKLFLSRAGLAAKRACHLQFDAFLTSFAVGLINAAYSGLRTLAG